MEIKSVHYYLSTRLLARDFLSVEMSQYESDLEHEESQVFPIFLQLAKLSGLPYLHSMRPTQAMSLATGFRLHYSRAAVLLLNAGWG